MASVQYSRQDGWKPARHHESADLPVGSRFRRLATLGEVFYLRKDDGNRVAHVVCLCDCGTILVKRVTDLRTGVAVSCGCYVSDRGRAVCTTHGLALGKTRPIYLTWIRMKVRCYNPRSDSYQCYGGRGIGVCDEWRNDAKAFVEWAVRNGWKRGLQIDRIDVNGSYSPGNCRWVTGRENSNNKRTNRFVEAFGERKTVAQWADDPRAAVSQFAIYARLDAGRLPEEAITTPPFGRKPQRRNYRIVQGEVV